MKILITGAAGFLGRHLVDLFSEDGHALITIARPTSDRSYLQAKGVRIIDGDLYDPAAIETASKGVDVVVHAAATLRGSWDDFEAINVKATQILLEQAVRNKVKRFVFISSIIVYDHSSAQPGTRFSEDMQQEEIEQTYYCKTKIQAEALVRQFHNEHKLRTVILRPAAIYGKNGPLFLSRLGFAAGGKCYLMVGEGTLPLPLSHVEGIAGAVKLAVEKDAAVGQTYNVVEDETISQKEFFAELRRQVIPGFSALRAPYGLMKFLSQSADKVLGLVGMTSPLPLSYMRLCAVPFFYSNEKIKKDLGWQTRPDFRQSLREMMLWHKKNRRSKRKLSNDDISVPIQSSRTLKAGIVGCGVISGPHLDALKRLKNAEVVAVCDPSEDARNTMAAKYGVTATYSDYKEMLEKEALDVVHVCTPAQSHAAISQAAMKKGCHVFVEKPMAMTAAEAGKMVSAAKRHKVEICVGHNHVYDKVMVQARTLLASGAIGRLCHVEAWYGTSYSSDSKSRYLTYAAKDNWAYQMPGSLYQNFISHPISLVQDLVDETQVSGVQSRFNRVVPHMENDELRVLFNGSQATGLINMSMAVSPRYFFLTVYGSEGTLKVDLLNKTVFLDKPSARLPRVIARSMMAFSQAKTLIAAGLRNLFAGIFGRYNLYQGNETLIRLFYKSILDSTPSPISADEGLRSMELMDKIWLKMPGGSGQTSPPPSEQPRAEKPARKKTSSGKKTARKRVNGAARSAANKAGETEPNSGSGTEKK